MHVRGWRDRGGGRLGVLVVVVRNVLRGNEGAAVAGRERDAPSG